MHNATRNLLEEIEVLKGRLRIAAILSFTQLVIVVGYFIVIGVLYIKKCVEKHRAAALEVDLLEMESRLASRKAKKRSAASRVKDRSSPASLFRSCLRASPTRRGRTSCTMGQNLCQPRELRFSQLTDQLPHLSQ